MRRGCVYIITTKHYQEENIYKIGCTKNLIKRLYYLNATRISNDYFYEVDHWDTFKYFDVENGLHKELKEYRLNNEFFKCSIDIIQNALKEYLSKKNQSYIFEDAVYEFSLIYKLKYNSHYNLYTISKNEIDFLYKEENVIKELQDYMDQFDKYNLFRFYHKNFWSNLLNMIKLYLEDIDDFESNFSKLKII